MGFFEKMNSRGRGGGWRVLVSAIEVKSSYTKIFLDSLVKEMVDNVTNFVV